MVCHVVGLPSHPNPLLLLLPLPPPEHRGIFVVIFVLPLSLLFDFVFKIRAAVIQLYFSAPELHEARVGNIQRQVIEWKKNGAGKKLCTARGGWQSVSPGYRPYKKNSTKINVNLFDILELDEKEMSLKVEPMVNMGQITHFLVPKNLTLPVLPELDDLTVGGLLMGVGIETSSHKHGLFNDNVLAAEVVLADGSLIKCSKKENRELFDALPWSYGTLGLLVSVTLKISRCKPFVRVEYWPCKTHGKGVEVYRKFSEEKKPQDFVEALAYSHEEMVVMPARYASEEEALTGTKNSIGLWFKPWFYKHVEKFLTKGGDGPWVEYIPLRDYYHRHTKSIFWELEQIIPWGNHPLFRLLLGWAVPPKVSFLKLTQTKALQELYETQHVIQDMLVPNSKVGEALTVFKEEFDLYPLWICPYRAYDYASSGAPHRSFLKKPLEATSKDSFGKYEMYVDLGAYGIPKAVEEKRSFDIVSVSRRCSIIGITTR
ncbi:hypothetical protein TL16_g01530 [Triparma laevis f. inornata]|uniref:Delta(24)-sterol reductase n=1 Tax=Triparma laevis f. inornata TaxID=1714386 RepID=A0A9W6ZNL7_9STRA|nr:hypothetical protein TL16_g01530 [Triparma laevis f. inornata]